MNAPNYDEGAVAGKLLPCPFCGGEAERYTVLPHPGFENRQVHCRTCGGSAFDRKWQVRAITPKPYDPTPEAQYVTGPIWREENEETVWTAEVQTIDGYYVIATVHGGSQQEAAKRQQAILAALAASTKDMNHGG